MNLLTVSTLPQEGPQRLQGVGNWPILDNGSVLRGDADSVSADLVPQVLNMIPKQLGFSW